MTSNQQNLYRELIDNLPAAAVYIIEDNLYLNHKATELTGYSSDDVKTIDEWFNLFGNNKESVRSLYEGARENNFPGVDRVLFTKRNGEARLIDFTGALTASIEVWLLVDVTEKILVEERFTVLFEHSTDAHLVFDQTGIIDCNNAAIKMLNARSKKQILEHHPSFFSPEFQPDGMKSVEKNAIIDKIVREKGFHSFEWVHKKITGEEFTVEVTLNPVVVANQKLVLVVWHDLTNVKEAQRKLEEERSLSFHASKMATLGEMASGIAHEINNPLTIILNKAMHISRLTCEDKPDLKEVGNSADKIFTTVGRISRIIRGLRSFARDGANDQMEAVALKNIIPEVLDLCQARFSSNGINLNLECLPDDSILENKVLCVNIQIEQVLLNLLNNAHDAVMSLTEKIEHKVNLTVTIIANSVCLAVEDTGPGIPKEIVEKIMNPFFTTKEVGKGTGLGLSISKGIVEKHNGELYLDSNSIATRFVVKLPLDFS